MENLTGNQYLTILQDAIDTIITQFVENSIYFPEDQFISEEKIVFQQDDCPAHYRKVVRNTLIRIIQIDV